MIKLNSNNVVDSATGLTGMVTHYEVKQNGARIYLFQPRGLNPENGQPVKRFWAVEERLSGGQRVPEPPLPLEVLGTEVEDEGTGFCGIAIAIELHPSGCIHVEIQPRGTVAKTGDPIQSHEFDIRRCKGPAIKALTEKQRTDAERVAPSPSESFSSDPRMP